MCIFKAVVVAQAKHFSKNFSNSSHTSRWSYRTSSSILTTHTQSQPSLPLLYFASYSLAPHSHDANVCRPLTFQASSKGNAYKECVEKLRKAAKVIIRWNDPECEGIFHCLSSGALDFLCEMCVRKSYGPKRASHSVGICELKYYILNVFVCVWCAWFSSWYRYLIREKTTAVLLRTKERTLGWRLGMQRDS